jgi:hypothetical protein
MTGAWLALAALVGVELRLREESGDFQPLLPSLPRHDNDHRSTHHSDACRDGGHFGVVLPRRSAAARQ